MNLSPIHEDEDLNEMRKLDGGKFHIVDTLDEDDDDVGEEAFELKHHDLIFSFFLKF